VAGYDTASEIQNVYQSAHNEFGADPNFWLRYFSPSPAADVFNSDPTAECEAAWSSGGKSIGCITEPSQGNLNTNSAQGQADAQTFCAAVYSAYTTVHPLNLPSNETVYCWLGQEASTYLDSGYWNGWAGVVAGYEFAENGTHPLYPCLYCNPDAPPPNCSIIDNPDNVQCVAVWSSEPEPCTASITNTPAWNAESCPSVATKLWQYAEQGACGLSANVDLDVGAPGFYTPDYCFNLAANP
jgi:hypothetical protein